MWSFPPSVVVREHTLDAIVVVPGLMGSALRDSERGVIWGFRSLDPYLSLWGLGHKIAPLSLTSAELDALAGGTYDPNCARVQPDGLIRLPAFAPLLGGFEPYTRLLRALRDAAAHPDAVLEFAYDWRLPIRINSQRLAREMKEHLSRWRVHPAHADARRLDPQQREAGLTIVAHSMGGLVARGLGDPTIENGFDNVHKVITLGTPFSGSVKAAAVLEHGESAPVHQRVRDVARTMPGLYDLLPRNPCLLKTSGSIDEVAELTVDDVVEIGGNRQLATASAHDFETNQSLTLPGHRLITGVHQPTWQSLQIKAGKVDPACFSYRWTEHGGLVRDGIGRPKRYDDQGDGTVWRYAARTKGAQDEVPIAQQHGALARSSEVISTVVAMVTDQGDMGVRLGAGDVGLDVPDTVPVKVPMTVTVIGEADPAQVTCRVADANTNSLVRRPRLRVAGDHLETTFVLPDVGLYRVEVKAGAGDPVTQIVMVTPPEN